MKLLRLLLLCILPFTGISQSPCNFDSSAAYQQCITSQAGVPGSQAIIIFQWFNGNKIDRVKCLFSVKIMVEINHFHHSVRKRFSVGNTNTLMFCVRKYLCEFE